MKLRFLYAALLAIFSMMAWAVPCDRSDGQIWITPSTGAEPLIQAIQNAHQSIEVVMYDFTNQTLLHALISAKYRGVLVSVIMEEAPYLQSDTNNRILKEMDQAQIVHHFGSPDFQFTHEKLLLIDHRLAFLSTGNFTYNSFEIQRNAYVEIQDPNLVQEISAVFWADWNKTPITPQSTALVWGPDDSEASLTQFISEAHHQLWLYAVTLSDPAIIHALIAKSKEGVNIHIITNAPQNSKARQGLRNLTANGIQVGIYDSQWIHAKVILRDPDDRNAAAYLGSSNLSYTSLHYNRELGVFLCAPSVIDRLKQTMTQDASKAQIF